MGALCELLESTREATIAGRSFQMGPLRLRHLAEIQRAASELRREEAGDLLARAAEASGPARRELLDRAYSDLRRSTADAKDVEQYLSTTVGAARIAWLCIRDATPEVELADVEAALSEVKASEAPSVVETLREAMGLPAGN